MIDRGRPIEGLVATHDAPGWDDAHPRAKRILHDAAAMGASHVLFRVSVRQDRPPTPQAFIFDLSTSHASATDEAEIQRQVWNYGLVPLIFVLRPDRVDIINALEKPLLDFHGNLEKPTIVDQLRLGAQLSRALARKNDEVVSRYSARGFANGTFWDDPKNRSLLSSSTAQKSLLAEMRRARIAINERGGLSGSLSRRFFILCLMVKYLEDRKILRPNYFQQFDQAATEFSFLLRSDTGRYAALRSCLVSLADRFNGDVFQLTAEEEDELADADLSSFADFIEGTLEGPQKHLWRLYSFEYLPVELISYIYEDFLSDNKEAVYTPHMLVDLLLDEVISIQNASDDFRVLDPACGSGVFLVGAFRRIVEAYQARNHMGPGQVPVDKLRGILENNIHGVDIDPVAVELTAFGLCIALSAELSADRALAELRFPTLVNKAIKRRDFFSLTENAGNGPGKYDLIIGNPPFASEYQNGYASRVAMNCAGPRKDFPSIPDKQLCYLFLREAPKLLKDFGVGCLLQKDGFLYNAGTREFRAAFIENYEVPQIFDFISIRGLFTGKKKTKNANQQTTGAESESEATAVDTKVVAVFFKRHPEKATIPLNPILHATFRKLFKVAARIGFELDAYDYHWVPRDLAQSEPRVWKANLLGGGRLLSTYRALTETANRTIGSFLREKMPDWACSEGYAVGKKGAISQPELTGLPCLWTKAALKAAMSDSPTGLRRAQLHSVLRAFTEGSVPWDKTTKISARKFKSTGDVRIYSPPHLIIWKHESLATHFRERGTKLAFSKRFVGIACPPPQIDELRALCRFFDDCGESLRFFPMFGTEMLVNRTSTMLKEDIMDIPYPEDGKLIFRGVEKALRDDVLIYQETFIKDGASLTSPLFKIANSSQLEQFSETFEGVLANTHPQVKAGRRYDLGNAFCLSFVFGAKASRAFGDPQDLEAHLDDLLHKQQSRSLRVQRVVRVFDGNCLFFVKPKAFRFWTRSIAVRDADEAFVSLHDQGF
jgi:hypothetical protein